MTLPTGFREMTALESDRLDGTCLLYDRSLNRVTKWQVESYSNASGWKLVQRIAGTAAGIVDSVRLCADDDDLDDRTVSCDDANYTAVIPIDPNDLTPLLRESFYKLDAKAILEELNDVRLPMLTCSLCAKPIEKIEQAEVWKDSSWQPSTVVHHDCKARDMAAKLERKLERGIGAVL